MRSLEFRQADDIGSILDWLTGTAVPFLTDRVAPAAAGVVALAMVLATTWWAARAQRARTGWHIQLYTPATGADAAATGRFWAEAATALRTRGPFPHRQIVFETRITTDGVRCGIRVPTGVNPNRIVHAARSAWPGSSATILEPPDLTVLAGSHRTVRRLVPADADPLPTYPGHAFARLADQQTYARPGQILLVQVAAAPAGTRRIRSLAEPGGGSSKLGEFLTDLWRGTTTATPTKTAGDVTSRPGWTQDRPVWTASIRVQSIVPEPSARRAREAVAEVTGAFCGFRAGTGLRSRPTIASPGSSPDAVFGFVLTNTELAAIAGPPPPPAGQHRHVTPAIPPGDRVLLDQA